MRLGGCLCKSIWVVVDGGGVNAGKDEVKGSEVDLTQWKGLVFAAEY